MNTEPGIEEVVPLRDRVERLAAALDEAEVNVGSVVLRGVTPEQLAEVFPEAKLSTYVNDGNDGHARAYAIDSATLPDGRIGADHHRDATPAEVEQMRAEGKEQIGWRSLRVPA